MTNARTLATSFATLTVRDGVTLQDVPASEGTRQDLRIAVRSVFVKVPVTVTNSSAKMREVLENLRTALAPRKSKRITWTDRLLTILPENGETTVTLTRSQMEGLNFPKSSMVHRAYWGANPAGRAARSLGWTPSLRKVDGETDLALVLTRAA